MGGVGGTGNEAINGDVSRLLRIVLRLPLLERPCLGALRIPSELARECAEAFVRTDAGRIAVAGTVRRKLDVLDEATLGTEEREVEGLMVVILDGANGSGEEVYCKEGVEKEG